MTILTARKICKTYGRLTNRQKVLHQIDISIEEQEFLGIMGPSGSGKTTLLQVLAGIERPSEGIVEIKGQPLHKLKGAKLANFRRREMGFVFQQYNLLNDLTIKENILLPFALTPKMKHQQGAANTLGKELDIHQLFHKYPTQLSGGQQQRTAIARALITKPSILFADEPTGALDSKAAADLLDKFAHFNQAHGQTILMVTHDAICASYCTRVLFLKDGRIYTELYRGSQSQATFYQNILATQALLGVD